MRISDWSSDVCSSDLVPWLGCGRTMECRGRGRLGSKRRHVRSRFLPVAKHGIRRLLRKHDGPDWRLAGHHPLDATAINAGDANRRRPRPRPGGIRDGRRSGFGLNEWLCAALHRSDEMNLQVDLKTQHYMQAHLFEDQYIIMIWPKETSLRRLQHAREIVDFQLDTFIESAKRDEPRKEYARLEVESWFAKST